MNTTVNTTETDRVYLTVEQAEAMLPDGAEIHTFVTPVVNRLIGADWARADILELLRKGSPELSGETATRMGHGLVVIDGGEPVFIETRRVNEAVLNGLG